MNKFCYIFITIFLLFVCFSNLVNAKTKMINVSYDANGTRYEEFNFFNNKLYALKTNSFSKSELDTLGNNGEILETVTINGKALGIYNGKDRFYIPYRRQSADYNLSSFDSNGKETLLFTTENEIRKTIEMNGFILYFDIELQQYKSFPENTHIDEHLTEFNEQSPIVFNNTKIFYALNNYSEIESLDLISGETQTIISQKKNFVVSFELDDDKNFLYVLQKQNKDYQVVNSKLYRLDLNNSQNGLELIKSLPPNSPLYLLDINDEEILFLDYDANKLKTKAYNLISNKITSKFSLVNRKKKNLNLLNLSFNQDHNKAIIEAYNCYYKPKYHCDLDSQFLYFSF